MLGLDYSQGRPTGAQVRADGYGFVARYLDNGLSGRSNLTVPEVMDMQANGVFIALVWERKIIGQPDRATQGTAAGAADAAAAKQAARALGLDGWPIYFAVDFDIPDYAANDPSPLAKLGPVGAYFGGVRSVLPLERVGVYGGFYAVSRVLSAGLGSIAWQTAAWSGGQVDSRAALFQHIGSVFVGGVECDVNETRQTYFGQAAAAAPRKKDIMFEFVCDTDHLIDATKPFDGQTNGFRNVALLLGGGYLGPATWDDVKAKDSKYGGDGTGSVLGKGSADYQLYVNLDAQLRARDAHLTTLGSVGGGSVPTKWSTKDNGDGTATTTAVTA